MASDGCIAGNDYVAGMWQEEPWSNTHSAADAGWKAFVQYRPTF
jgi:hypothetical protein